MKLHHLSFAFILGLGPGCSGADTSQVTGPVELQVSPPDQRPIATMPGDALSVIVIVDRIEAGSDEHGWSTVASTKQPVDLVKLDGATLASLGVLVLPVGTTTQLRFIVSDGFLITKDNVMHALQIPSGMIEVEGSINLHPCQTGFIQLSLDGDKSLFVHPTGNDDLWILRPMLRVNAVSLGGGC